MKKISERAMWLLWCIGQATERNWETGELHRYFVPSAKMYHYRDNGHQESTYISGNGDAKSLKALESRGLIEPKSIADYAYALTEDGLMYIENNRLNERFE